MRVIGADEVEQLLDMASCISAIEDAFRALGEGRASSSIGGLELAHGGLHAKMGVIGGANGYAAAKINANFPDNPSRHGLPTVQGVVIVFDVTVVFHATNPRQQIAKTNKSTGQICT